MTNLWLDPIKKKKKNSSQKTFSKRIKNKTYSQLKLSQKKLAIKKKGKVSRERERSTKRKVVQRT